VRRLGLALFLAASVAFSAGSALADDGTTTGVTTTAPAATTTTAPAPPTVIADGVTIDGVDVGGLTQSAASARVSAAASGRLRLVLGPTRLAPTRAALGARTYVDGAVRRALASDAGTAVRAAVAVDGATLRSYLAGLARRYDRPAVSARLLFRGGRPIVTAERTGLRLKPVAAAAAVVQALRAGSPGPVRLPAATPKPAVTSASIGPVIVIHRGANRLELFDGAKPWRTFPVATGQAAYPTPLGSFHIVVKWENPWWYPPASPWAAGEKPVPPGPGNPLGTRWMGISSPGVGIHGTNEESSIGYSLSHGCIRMHVPDAEWLYAHVNVGTPVYIVPS
jgi:lipoprotein-anchoring transpeptidase ErfK/SrfK